MTARTVSVVVATRNRPEDLAACLRSVARADDGRLAEVIVVDDASDRPYELDPGLVPVPVRMLRRPVHAGPDQCRNDGVALAVGDDIGFLDDDARVPHDWFAVAGAAADAGLRAFTGRVLPFDRGVVSRSRQWRYDQRYAGLRTGQPVGFLAGGNSVVDRELFRRAGGFPVRSAGGDNGLVLGLAELGVECRFVRELRILHRNGKGVRMAALQSWRAGRSAPASPSWQTLTECARGLGRLTAAPPDVGLVNGALQLCNTAGRLAARRGA